MDLPLKEPWNPSISNKNSNLQSKASKHQPTFPQKWWQRHLFVCVNSVKSFLKIGHSHQSHLQPHPQHPLRRGWVLLGCLLCLQQCLGSQQCLAPTASPGGKAMATSTESTARGRLIYPSCIFLWCDLIILEFVRSYAICLDQTKIEPMIWTIFISPEFHK